MNSPIQPGFENSRDAVMVSMVVPVFNGSALLEKHLEPYLHHLKALPYKTQVVLVDDGSADQRRTAGFAEKHGLRFFALDANRGKGAALRKGFELAEGAIQLFTDADIPFRYANVDGLVARLRENPDQLIIGDRTGPLSDYFDKASLLRNIGSQVVSALVDRFFIAGVRDTQCGLKGMGRTVARTLFAESRIDRFAIDIELIYLAYKNHIPVQKIPVQLRYNDKSTVNTPKDGLKLLRDLHRIRQIHGKRKFS